MFENDTVELNQIPHYQEVDFNSLHSDYVKILRMNAAITLFVGLAISTALFFVFEDFERFYFIGAVLFVFLNIAIFPLIAYKKKKYAFRQHDAIYSSGLIFKSTHIIPYIRLQHVVIKQGWYAKRLGLAALQLHTAANDNIDVTIPGLTLEDAERWKSYLVNRLQELEDETEA